MLGVEAGLSYYAFWPIVGIVAGAIKMIIGIIQAVAGLLACIWFSCEHLTEAQGSMSFRRAIDHVGNGVANIIAGALEAIPLLGTVIGCIRLYQACTDNSTGHNTTQSHTLVCYYPILDAYPNA